MKLRVGLIGLGRSWQKRHAPILRAMGDRFDVRAVCDQVAHRAQQAARELGARPVGGFRALVNAPDVDAILMLASQWYGALPVMAACDAGKAVYCAVALDIDLKQAEAIKQRVDQAGIAFMAELPKRHAPATSRLKELIATQLGPPRLIFGHHRLVSDAQPNRPDEPRNGPMRILIELVDWCRFIAGREPDKVIHVGHPAVAVDGNYDYEMLSLHFPSDPQGGASEVTAQISCGSYFPSSWPEAISFRRPAAIQVACENGIAFVDLPSQITWFDTAGRHLESLEAERPVEEQLFAQFYRAVTSLVRRQSDLEDAYRSMSIVLAGRAVELGQEASLKF
ncbi:MAG: Gfo/Idh/MocA family oxidoreductase [Planctomycetales bacterium]|nr:Gfo/Idh/MocA family oxidoreductase [Planctomycetales bacterium]